MAFAQSLLYKSAAIGARPAITMYMYTSFDVYSEVLAPGYFKRNPRFDFVWKDVVICQCPDGLHIAEVSADTTTVQPTYMPVVGNTLLSSDSALMSQEPSAVDTPLTIDFGGAVGTASDKLQILANQHLQANEPLNNLRARIKLQVGRTGEPMEAKLYFRLVLNGTTQVGTTLFTRIDGPETAHPLYFTAPLQMAEGDQLHFEMIRDSAGANSGGLYVENPTLPGWNDASSASILVYEDVVR